VVGFLVVKVVTVDGGADVVVVVDVGWPVGGLLVDPDEVVVADVDEGFLDVDGLQVGGTGDSSGEHVL
jgi:hypothetical protein